MLEPIFDKATVEKDIEILFTHLCQYIAYVESDKENTPITHNLLQELHQTLLNWIKRYSAIT